MINNQTSKGIIKRVGLLNIVAFLAGAYKGINDSIGTPIQSNTLEWTLIGAPIVLNSTITAGLGAFGSYTVAAGSGGMGLVPFKERARYLLIRSGSPNPTELLGEMSLGAAYGLTTTGGYAAVGYGMGLGIGSLLK